MSRKDIWSKDILDARDRWKTSRDIIDYEIYAIACAAYLCSTELADADEHWFCERSSTRSMSISSLIIFSFTLPEDPDDPAYVRYRNYERKLTHVLSRCKDCAVAYQCCDNDLMNELVDQAGLPEQKVILFFKELHRKDRVRLSEQIKLNKQSVPVLTEILWSIACMTVSNFVNEMFVGSKLLAGGILKELEPCPGFLILVFVHSNDLRTVSLRKVLKPENVSAFASVWSANGTRFNKMFSLGLKRNVHAAHMADLAWYSCSLMLDSYSNEPNVRDTISRICITEMITARGLPKFGAHLLVLQILKHGNREVLSQNNLERVLDYVTSYKDLKWGAIDPLAPEPARLSDSYKDLDATIIIEWMRLYLSSKLYPKAINTKARLEFLLALGTDAFKNSESYQYVSKFAVKTASAFPESEIVDLVLAKHGPRLAAGFFMYKSHWICTLWKLQLASEHWRPFWNLMIDEPDFAMKSTSTKENSGTLMGILQGSKDVALLYKLPTKNQKNSTDRAPEGSQQTRAEKFIQSLLESVTDACDSSHLFDLLLDRHVLRASILLSVSGNRNLALAAEEFMKQAVGDDCETPEEAIQYFVKNHTELVLTAMNSILSEASPAEETWLAVMPGLIRMALSVLDQIYSIRDGIDTSGNEAVLRLLFRFWEQSWLIVANVIKSIRTWAANYAVSHVKSVLIVVLEFSEGLLSKFRLLDADLCSIPSKERTWGAKLADPAIMCVNGMGDMLQLAIPELLAKSVAIIIEILGLMRSFQVAIPDSLLSLLEGLATKRLNSKLSKEQLKDLLGATELSEEKIIDIVENGPSRLKKLMDEQAQHGEKLSTRHSSSQTQKSISDFFKSTGGEKPKQAPRPIINNQVVPVSKNQPSQLSLIRAELGGHLPAGTKSLNSRGFGPGVTGTIHPERPPGFNPPKGQARHGGRSDDDDEDDDDDDIGALQSLGAQKKREAATQRLREAFEQSKSRTAPQLIAGVSGTARIRQIQQQKDLEERNMKARLHMTATKLHLEILSWDYFAELPPTRTKTVIPDTFQDVTHYQSVMCPLLYLEAWEQIQNSKLEAEKSRQPCLPLILGKRVKVDSFTDVYVSIEKQAFLEAKISESDLLLLSYDKLSPGEVVAPRSDLQHCFARVKEGSVKNASSRSKAQFVDFQVRMNGSQTFLNSLSSGAIVSALSLGGFTTVEREFTALMALPYYDLLEPILKARPAISEDQPNQIQRLQKSLGLNQSQATAVSRSVSNPGFTLIQGPPGTGKTKTILGVIGALLTPNSLVSGSLGNDVPESRKILVCAPSNAAVDEMVLRLKKGVLDSNGNHQEPKILRLGRVEKMAVEIRDVSLEDMMSKELNETAEPVDNELRKEHTALTAERNKLRAALGDKKDTLTADEVKAYTDQLRDVGRRMREKAYALDMQRDRLRTAQVQRDQRNHQRQLELLQKTQVICTTLSGSAHPILTGFSSVFDTVIIDEAAQSIELASLNPLKYGCKKCIMVGDPNQLPPTVMSQEASRLKYEQSLFVRMFNQYKGVKGAVSMLDTQFRMHPDISKFPSKEFYAGRLKDAEGLSSQLVRPWHEQYRALGPYTFFEVRGRQERGGGGKSFKNTTEAVAALDLVRFVLKEFPDIQSIGVISPYREQVQLMRSMFIKDLGHGITSLVSFNSIDGFQGQEKDLIVMSCVRASDAKTNNVGFLGDVRRMNVAITRAKASLWLLGHSSSLTRNSVWRSLIEDAQSRGRFVAAHDNIIAAVKGFNKGSSVGQLPPSRNFGEGTSVEFAEKRKLPDSCNSNGSGKTKKPHVDQDVGVESRNTSRWDRSATDGSTSSKEPSPTTNGNSASEQPKGAPPTSDEPHPISDKSQVPKDLGGSASYQQQTDKRRPKKKDRTANVFIKSRRPGKNATR